MKKNFYLLLLLILSVLIFAGCNKEEKKEEEQKEEEVVGEKINVVATVSDIDDWLYFVDDNFDLVKKIKLVDKHSAYEAAQVDGSYIYYISKGLLHRFNTKNSKDENLEIDLSSTWTFSVSGDDLIYTNLFDVHYINLNDK